MKVIGENVEPVGEKSNAELASEAMEATLNADILQAGTNVRAKTIQATHKLITLFNQAGLAYEIEEIRKQYGFHLVSINPETHPEDYRQARSHYLVLNDLLQVFAMHKTLHNKIVKEQIK